jgi:hypothetical protein
MLQKFWMTSSWLSAMVSLSREREIKSDGGEGEVEKKEWGDVGG